MCQVRGWGHGRPRRVATFAGPEVVRPRRSRCADCGRTNVLLPSQLLSRRRYAAPVIFAALALRAAGLKLAAVAARLRLLLTGPARAVVERAGLDRALVAGQVRWPGGAAATAVDDGAAAG
jgi:hypothetical protein